MIEEINAGTQRNPEMAAQAATSTEGLRNEARLLTASVASYTHEHREPDGAERAAPSRRDRPETACSASELISAVLLD
jgi:hypothetical protein